MNVQIVHTKKNMQKITNIEYYMNLSIRFSLKGKKHFFSQKGQQIYKLRAIHSEEAFSEIKENTGIQTIQKKRTNKS